MRLTMVAMLATLMAVGALLAPSALAAESSVARHGLTPAEYQNEFTRLAGEGYRLIDVSGYDVNGSERYAAIWRRAAGPAWQARHGLSAAQLQATVDELRTRGFRPTLIDGYRVAGVERYAAIFQRDNVAWAARHGLTSAQYQAAFDMYAAQGYRLRHISGYASADGERYAAVWERAASPAWQARHGLTPTQYQGTLDALAREGYRPVQVDAYTVAGVERYAAIFTRGDETVWVGRHGLSPAQLQAESDFWTAQGYGPTEIDGHGTAVGERFAAIWTRASAPPSAVIRLERQEDDQSTLVAERSTADGQESPAATVRLGDPYAATVSGRPARDTIERVDVRIEYSAACQDLVRQITVEHRGTASTTSADGTPASLPLTWLRGNACKEVGADRGLRPMIDRLDGTIRAEVTDAAGNVGAAVLHFSYRPRLRVLVWNVSHGQYKPRAGEWSEHEKLTLARFLPIINSARPNVALLQEIHRRQFTAPILLSAQEVLQHPSAYCLPYGIWAPRCAEEPQTAFIAQSTELDFSHFRSNGRTDDWSQGFPPFVMRSYLPGEGVFARWPIFPRPSITSDDKKPEDEYPMPVGTALIDGKPHHLVSLHWHNYGGEPDDVTNRRHNNGAEALRTAMKSWSAPAIIAGDFNHNMHDGYELLNGIAGMGRVISDWSVRLRNRELWSLHPNCGTLVPEDDMTIDHLFLQNAVPGSTAAPAIPYTIDTVERVCPKPHMSDHPLLFLRIG